jgi:hypothetical protein
MPADQRIQTTPNARVPFMLTLVLATAGALLHAQVAAGGPLNVTTDFTVQLPARTCQIVLGSGGANPVTYTISGLGMDGKAQTDTIVATGAGTYQGTKAFTSITKLVSDVDPLGTTDLGTGVGFGIPNVGGIIYSIDALSVLGVVEAGVLKNPATGTVIPTTAPNNTRVFSVAGTYDFDGIPT